MPNLSVRASVRRVTDPVGEWLVARGLSPDAVTVTGTLGTVVGAVWLVPTGHLFAAAVVMTVFVLFDIVDGAMARSRGVTSAFGGVLDSVCDRIADGVLFAALVWWERRRALRQTADNKVKRDLRNIAIAALAGAVVQCIEVPVAFGLARHVKEKRWGLVQQLPLAAPARAILAIVLLDYTLYLWHVLTHRVPFLWRFHEVHHIDREMDATTALRFHFGEVAISVLFRAAQVLIIGPAPIAVASWQIVQFVYN